MAETQGRRRLGRGLAALIEDDAPEAPARGPDAEISVDLIDPNPNQPRRRFDPDEIESLAQSIRARGVLQPLLLRPAPDAPGRYQIVAGERRWRAAQAAQRHAVPAIVREFSDGETLEAALLENIQRADLSAVEEAEGYVRLIERHGHTQAQIAAFTGKSRSHVANTIRLLQLPTPVLALIENGALSAGHARAALSAADPAAFAQMIVAEGLTVREAEARVQAANAGRTRRGARSGPEKDPDTRALEADLAATLGLRVSLRHKADGGGDLVLRYKDLEQLDQICRLLSN